MKLEHKQLAVMRNALTVAAEQYDVNAKMFLDLAESLRNGAKHPLFADGEAGARAADRLADQFNRQAEEARDLARESEEHDEDDA